MALPKTLAALDGTRYFAARALQQALDDTGERSRVTLVAMRPADFLALALSGRAPEKEEGVENLLVQGQPFSSLPHLSVQVMPGQDYLRVTGHEGRHRMRALQSRGVQQVPVLIRTDRLRWSEQGRAGSHDKIEPFPTRLLSEDHMRHRPLPDSLVDPRGAHRDHIPSPAPAYPRV